MLGDFSKLVRIRRNAAAAFAAINLDQGGQNTGMGGDGAGDIRIIGDDLHVIALRVQRGDGVQLLRCYANGVDLIPIAAAGEIARLRHRADGDRPMIRCGKRGHRQAFRRFHMRA